MAQQKALQRPGEAGAAAALAAQLHARGDALLAAQLDAYLQRGPGSDLLRQADSGFLGRRVHRGPGLPGAAAAGDLWFDPVEVSLQVLVAAEPEPVPMAGGQEYPVLLGWLGLRPVAAWQLAAFRALAGGPPQADAGDELRAATGVTWGEAWAYAKRFGKQLSDHLLWQAAALHLSEAAREELWGDLQREWSGLRSTTDTDLVLLVRREDSAADPEEELLAARRAHLRRQEAPPLRSACAPTHSADDLGLRTAVSMQLGLTAAAGRG